MKKFCIKEIELKLWEDFRAKQVKIVEKTRDFALNCPTSQLIDIHIKFAKMISESTGKQRLEKSFMDEISRMAKKEKELNKKAKNYNITEASDNHIMQELILGEVLTKIANLKFYMKIN